MPGPSNLQQWRSQADPGQVSTIYSYATLLLNEKRSVKEIRQRLEARGVPPAVADELVQSLKRGGKGAATSRKDGCMLALGGLGLILLNILIYVGVSKIWPHSNSTVVMVNVTLAVAGLGLIGKGLGAVIMGR